MNTCLVRPVIMPVKRAWSMCKRKYDSLEAVLQIPLGMKEKLQTLRPLTPRCKRGVGVRK